MDGKLTSIRNTGLKYSCRNGAGLTPVVSPENADLKLIEFGVIRLSARKRLIIPCAGKEIVLLLLSGSCLVKAKQEEGALGPRTDIFSEFPWTVYIRGIPELQLVAVSTTEALISAAPSSSRQPFVKLIPPGEVVDRVVGENAYRRHVRTVIGEDFPAERLLLGETINEAGKWSSYPPHRHERNSPPHEAKLEEVYYYRTEKPNGFGLQRIYTDDGRIDETHTVRSGDVCVLPRGYHPVSAAPCSKLYYFWVLAGKNRKMQVRVDPKFA
jgi:5-deoxy-glucuronate isomerase